MSGRALTTIILNDSYAYNCMVNILLQSCVAETMRASVILLFAVLTLTFVVVYAADEVSVYGNISGYLTLENTNSM